MSTKTTITRRAFLKRSVTLAAGLGGGGLLLAACGAASPTAPGAPAAGSPAAGGQTFDWKQFSGETVNVLLTKNPWADTLVTSIPEFESLTGMKASVESIPEVQARQKITIDFAGGGTIDAFFTSLHVEKRRFSGPGWYEPLNTYLANPKLTAPDYNFEQDVFESSRGAATSQDGKLLALPIFTDIWAFFYRKDLFDAKGLKPLATFDDMTGDAKALHNPPELYSYIARGLKNANAIGWTWMLRSFGGRELTADRKANLSSAEAVQAMDLYAGLLRQYAPPGVVKGKVGYAVLPAGPKAKVVPAFTTGMAVSALSKKKEPAYLFCQWATNKAAALKAQLAGIGTARQSAWDSPEAKSKSTMPQAWTDVFRESLKVGTLGLPEIVGVTEYRDIIGVAIQSAIQGQDSKTVLDQAQKEFQDVLDKTEK